MALWGAGPRVSGREPIGGVREGEPLSIHGNEDYSFGKKAQRARDVLRVRQEAAGLGCQLYPQVSPQPASSLAGDSGTSVGLFRDGPLLGQLPTEVTSPGPCSPYKHFK